MLETLNEACFDEDFFSIENLLQRCPAIQRIDPIRPFRATAPVAIYSGDITLDQAMLDSVDSPSVKLWLINNRNCSNPKTRSLPLCLPDLSHDHILGNSRVIQQENHRPKTTHNLVLMAFRDTTWPCERSKLRRALTGKAHVTEQAYDRTLMGYARYVSEIYRHTFILSPRGNGIDCHRTWESLYLRSIPILKRDPVLDFCAHLPILFVDEWEQVLDVNFLEAQRERLSKLACDFSIMRLSYWTKLVQSYAS